MAPMTHSGAAKVTLPADEQILITREFDAPRHLVYKAYTTPELIRRWWAGKRGNVTVADVDLRVGGIYRYALVTDDGIEVAFNGEFREIVENERLVNTEIFEGAPPSDDDPVLNVVTFTELDGDRTLLELLVQCPNKAVRDIIIDSGMEGGMQEGMDALEQVAIALR
jgi:uncharacterized protein YndB with AHSA1/START domain